MSIPPKSRDPASPANGTRLKSSGNCLSPTLEKKGVNPEPAGKGDGTAVEVFGSEFEEEFSWTDG